VVEYQGKVGDRAREVGVTSPREELRERMTGVRHGTGTLRVGRGGSMGNSMVWFLGSVFSVVVSGLFWMLARRAEDSGLARATAVAVVVFCLAAIYFAIQL
jgi:hypothetical protein